MQRLLRLELQVRGEFRDLWLYKERMYLWDRSGVLRYCRLDVIAKWVEKRDGIAIANLLRTLIFRNDWKVGEQFTSWMRIEAVRRAVLDPLWQAGHITVEVPAALFTKSGSATYAGIVLDSHIYANRLFLATTEGLLESYINPRHPNVPYGLDQQTDIRAARVTAKYGAINVSAETEGLHWSPLFMRQEGEDPAFVQGNWRQVADVSFASSFARRNVLNYAEGVAPTLLHSQTEERRGEGDRFDDVVITGYETHVTDVESLALAASTPDLPGAHVSPDSSPDRDDFEVIGNSDFRLLVNSGGHLNVLDLRDDQLHGVEAVLDAKFSTLRTEEGIDPDAVLATYAVSGGFVVELNDRLDLITPAGSFVLHEGDAARVQTFEGSKRHKEAVAVVQEHNASVLGFLTVEATDDDQPTLFRRRPWD